VSDQPVAGVDYPRNWHELLRWFPDDAACLRYLEKLRWGRRFTGRFCGAIDAGWFERRNGAEPERHAAGHGERLELGLV
jgi:hypothetical protein